MDICKLRVYVASMSVFWLAGCGINSIRDQAQVDAVVTTKKSVGTLNVADYPRCSTSQWLDRASSGSGCPNSATDELTLRKSDLPPNSVELRNATQAELMTFSDLECKVHEAGIYGTQSGVNFLTSLGSLALAAASTVTDRGMGSSGRSARNLAAGSGLLGGARGLVNSEIYYSYIAPAVIAEIDLTRQQARAHLLAKQHCSVASYPPARAINDALNYHETCSFISGLTSLLKKAGVEKRDGDPSKERRVQDLKKRIDDLKASIAQAKSEKQALGTDANKAAERAQYDQQIAKLEQEVARWEELQVFFGPADPVRIGYAANSFKERIVTAQLAHEAAAQALELTPKDKNAVALVASTKTALATARLAQLKASVMQRQIEELRADLASITSRLYQEKKLAQPNAALILQFTQDIAAKEKTLATLRKEQIDLGLPDGASEPFSADLCLSE
jgi:hypothetical protein